MDVNMNVNHNYGVEAYRQTQATASGRERNDNGAIMSVSQTQNTQDTVEISAEGLNYMLQQAGENMQLRRDTKSKEVPDSFHTVDPDGSLYNKAYWAAYAERLTAAVKHVEEYYADRMKEFSGMTVQEGMMHLRNKYIDSASSIFCSGMSAAERSMSYKQELTLFLGGNVIIGDRYALKAHGGLLNVNEMDAYAKKAAEDYLNSLLNNNHKLQSDNDNMSASSGKDDFE